MRDTLLGLFGLLVLAVILLFLPSCESAAPASTPLPAPLAAQATAQYADAAQRVALAQSAAATADAAYVATLQANDQRRATQTAYEATLGAVQIEAAQANRDTARLQVTIAASEAQLAALDVLSKTNEVTSTFVIRAAEVEKKSSAAYILLESQAWPRLVLGVIVLAVGIAVAVVIVVLGWSARGHVAKRFEANGITYFVPLTGAPLPLLLNPPTLNGDGADHENTAETDNAETQSNTAETVIPLNHSGQTSSLVKMTPAERAELLAVRHEAIGLLSKCVDYYRRSGQIDNGIIPRYDVLRINAEARGIIVDNLVYSGLASKVVNKRSFIMPEFGTCQSALDAIAHNQVRVYPVGYHQRRQAMLESAVGALPARQREALS